VAVAILLLGPLHLYVGVDRRLRGETRPDG